MANKLVEFRLRIRNAANSADALEVTSVRGGTNPYISEDGIPSGDGASFDPITGVVTSGSFTGKIIDPITSGSSRLFTSVMEDGNFRQQLGHRRAFWEYREDGGSWTTLYAGRITAYELANDIEWSVTVGDFMQAEHEFTAFDPEPSETIADFLARWPKRGCLCGGPVIGGFLTEQDMGGWEMRVHTGVGSNRYWLEPVSVYGPGGWRKGQNILDFAAQINEIVSQMPRGIPEFATQALTTVDDSQGGRTWWPGLIALVNNVPFRLMPPFTAGIVYGGLAAHENLISTAQGFTGLVVKLDNQSALTNNTIVKVRVLTVLPSESSPIYFSGHPIDLATALLDEAGLPYDAASVETVRDTLGSGLRFAGRFTKPEPVGALLEAAVYGYAGIGTRPGDDGETEFFASRIFANTVPATTITEADVIQDETEAFSLDTTEAVRRVILEHTRIRTDIGSSSTDRFVTQSERFERESADPGVIGTGEASYVVPGMIDVVDTIDMNLLKWVAGRANEITDRYGRAPIRFKTVIIRGSAAMSKKIGDEILVDYPSLPNKNKRLIDDGAIPARAMQIVHLTKRLDGNAIECVDSGPNANAISTLPTHTITAAADLPRNVAELTITNAATLNASSYAVRVQIAVTPGGAPAVEDYTDFAFYAPGAVPTAAIRLPAVIADRDVYARARTEKQPERPSNWTTGVGVALDALDAPSSFTATDISGDGSLQDLAWTIGADAGSAVVDVYLRASGAPSSDRVIKRTLPAGSTRYRLDMMTPNTAYTASVQHRDPTTGDLSALVDVTFTTDNSTFSLSAPTNPDGFSVPARVATRGPDRPIGPRDPEPRGDDWRYGIAVVATQFPGEIEIAEAIETAPASGSYGSFSTVPYRIPSIAGDWTIWGGLAPSDGLRRKLKARHVRDGTTASSYTSEVVVDPAVTDAIAAFPILPGAVGELTLEDGAVTEDKIADEAVTPPKLEPRLRTLAYRASAQSIPDNTPTLMAWTDEAYDVGGLHSTVTNNSRITVPTGWGGFPLMLIAAIRWAPNGTGSRTVQILKNGSSIAITGESGDANGITIPAMYVDVPADGDYYDVEVNQNSGGSLNVTGGSGASFFQATFLT